MAELDDMLGVLTDVLLGVCSAVAVTAVAAAVAVEEDEDDKAAT